jgi:hypothetical protein
MELSVRTLILISSFFVACSGDEHQVGSDAPPRADAPPSCPPATQPLAAGTFTVYLSFEGATIHFGDCDDAKTDCSGLVLQATTVVPSFLGSDAARGAHIATITSMVQDALAPFSVDVVTTRPTSGNYWMVSIGGTSDGITGVPDLSLAAKPVCDAMNKSSLAFVFEKDPTLDTPDRAYADTVAAAFGRLLGLVPTRSARDCMCVSSTCTHTQLCTWGTATLPEAMNSCNRTMQNEQLLLMDAIGCRS